MLCRQRTFFLTENQYEPVILEYVGIVNGRQTYRFNKEEPDVNGYTVYARISNNGGLSWGDWYSNAIEITSNPASFSFPFDEGSMCEVYVVVTGDGTKDPSEPSNTITAITPASPAQPTPVIEGYVFYVDGEPTSAIKPLEIPTGVSEWVVWQRVLGTTQWNRIVSVSGGLYAVIPKELTDAGTTYEYIIAWYDSGTNKLLSDVSNIATVALPSASSTTLLPPINLGAYFYGEYNESFWNILNVARGDMRATAFEVYERRSTVGTWNYVGDYVFSEHGVENLQSFSINHNIGTTPITGEVWNYRLKNKATGYTTSEYSSTFVITIPSFLPKLDSPVINLLQSGEHVVIGWGAVQNADGYKIERRLSSASSFTTIATLPSSYTQFEDYGTSFGYTYYYRVTALGDNQFYQDSNPTQDSITLTNIVVLDAPVIDSVTESGINVVLQISNINTPNTQNVRIYISENSGSWRLLGAEYPPSQGQTTITYTVRGEDILEGGSLRFRARAMPAGQAVDPSPYSEIASITIDKREWLLRWTGSAWDYCTSATGGWSSPNMTFSDGVVAGNVQAVDLGGGTLRLQGTGYYMTGALTSGQTALTSKYKKICMIGSLIKQSTGLDYHAWFGSGHTYPFSGGTSIERRSSYYVFAGSESGRGAAGTLNNPQVNACAAGTYSNSTGAHVFFRFYSGYADVKGIFAIKQ